MSTPFTTYAYPLTSVQSNATTNRTQPTRQTDILNVKDFGATGDGVTDDTTAIQNCLDAAFGTWASTRGPNSAGSNKAVFFPNGGYVVSARSSGRVVTGTSSRGTGSFGQAVRLQFGSAHGYSNGDIVYVRGVGGTLAANGSHQISEASSVATEFTLPQCTFDAAWTSGGTVREPCLRVHNTKGGKIFGSGKTSTVVATNSTNCAVISLLGWGYGNVSDIGFSSEQGGIALDSNGNGLVLPVTATDPNSNQSNLFLHCAFGGGASANGDYSVTIGSDQQMCSETAFIDCYFACGDIAGVVWMNANALSGSIIGGNIAIGGNPSAGRYGIYVVAGSCPTIQGVGLQMQSGVDINIAWDANDAYSITGCRSESLNFVQGPSVTTLPIFIGGCAMTSPHGTSSGFFYIGGGHVTIDGCQGGTGHFVSAANGSMIINNSPFNDTNYLSGNPLSSNPTNYNYLEVHPQPQTTVTSTQTSIPSYYGGQMITYSSSSPMSAVLLKNSDGSNRLTTGSFIDVVQGASGSVTFSSSGGVTITSRSSFRSLAGVGSQARLTCLGSDSWLLAGDLA